MTTFEINHDAIQTMDASEPYTNESMDAAPQDAAAPNGFESLNLNPALLQAVDALGYTQPTPVQIQTIPAALAGGDWMVSSQTGSGKTAAFLLPAIHALLASPPMSKGEQAARGRRAAASPRVLVLAPTRELAQQVAQEAIGLVRFCRGVRIANVVGGTAFGKQLMDLRGATLVVATPGRLLDLNRNGQIDLNAVQTLVVDEADRMLDLGFSEDLEAIHVATSKRDRTMMFSATFAPRIMTLAANVMRNPERIELATAQDTHANIEQFLHWYDDMAHKNALLEHYLSDESMEQAVVFTATQVDADELADELREAGYSAAALHGAMPQAIRNRRIKSLRDGTTKILVATDVAARGIDVPTISHVINYGLPMKPEDYVHRIGRTGRAGRNGVAVTLAGGRDRFKIRNIESFTQQRLNVTTIAGHEPKTSPSSGYGPRRNDRGFGGDRGFADRGHSGDRSHSGDRNFGDRSRSSGFADRAPRAHEERRVDAPAHIAAPVERNDRFERPQFVRETRRDTPSPYANHRSDSRDFRAPRSDARSFGAPAAGGFNARSGADRGGRSERSEHRGERFDRGASESRPDYRSERSAQAAPRDFGSNDRVRPYVRPVAEREFGAAASSGYAARTPSMPVYEPRAAHRTDRAPGPALTPPAPGGNRAARRAHLHAMYQESAVTTLAAE